MRPLCDQRGQRITVDTPQVSTAIAADPTLVLQALTNLVSNASRFTSHGGRINVRVTGQGSDMFDTTHGQAVAECMVGIPAGEIVVRDEGTRTSWMVEVGAFRLAPYPVTYELYRAVAGEVPVSSVGPAGLRMPVTEVSWKDAVGFCNLFSQATGRQPGTRWARTQTAETWSVTGRPTVIAFRRRPNAWGLYDMIGNVWEWCWDVYDPRVYGPYRVFRGGGAHDQPRGCRASCRRKSHPAFHIDDLGFRLARSR